MKIEKATVYEVVHSWTGCSVREVDAYVWTHNDGSTWWCPVENPTEGFVALDVAGGDAFTDKGRAGRALNVIVRKNHAEASRRLHRRVAEAKENLRNAEAALKAHKAKKPAKETN